MCFYHSVAIIFAKDDLLEVLGLKQIVNIFPWQSVRKTPLCMSLCKMVIQIVLGCEKS